MKRVRGPYAMRLAAGTAFVIVSFVLLPRLIQTFGPEPVVVTDCFGGILAHDVVHCNVIQSAHNEGVITVKRMYTANSGRLLHIFISQDGSDLEGIFEQLKAKADAEIDALDDPSLCRIRAPGWCQPGTFPDYRLGPTFMPQSEVYVDVRLHGGGAIARRDEPGWASFQQVWSPEGELGMIRADSELNFDVADIDTSKPRIDCSDIWADHTRVCPELKRHPDLGLARWVASENFYVEVKALPGQEGQAVAAAREEISARFQLTADESDLLVVIPVKYSYEELWHWQTILDRFAHSAGNTVGVYDGEVRDNRNILKPDFRYEFPDPPGLEQVPFSGYDEARVRATIIVSTLDLEATVAALPRLLPQLGIPVDAVGMVYELSNRPFPGMELLPAE